MFAVLVDLNEYSKYRISRPFYIQIHQHLIFTKPFTALETRHRTSNGWPYMGIRVEAISLDRPVDETISARGAEITYRKTKNNKQRG
jgi:hypothetical protein